MTSSEHSKRSLEAQIEQLRRTSSGDSAQRVQTGMQQRARLQRRQVIAASFGACVAAIATFHFIRQDDPFGYFALTLATVVFIFVAWRSAHQAVALTALKSGVSLLAGWRAELKQQLRHALLSQLVAVQFVVMTAWVLSKNDLLSLKSSLFLLTATSIVVFAAYQFLVIRPALRRELRMLDEYE